MLNLFCNQMTGSIYSLDFRRIYPVIILTKGPLGWNWDYIKNNSVKVFSLATLPWIVECFATAFFAHILLDYPWYWGKHFITYFSNHSYTAKLFITKIFLDRYSP